MIGLERNGMPRAREKTRHRPHRRLLHEADLPSVPELNPSPAQPDRADESRTAADTDPTEDAIRKMIEAAYT
jgi:hypothetical protein